MRPGKMGIGHPTEARHQSSTGLYANGRCEGEKGLTELRSLTDWYSWIDRHRLLTTAERDDEARRGMTDRENMVGRGRMEEEGE